MPSKVHSRATRLALPLEDWMAMSAGVSFRAPALIRSFYPDSASMTASKGAESISSEPHCSKDADVGQIVVNSPLWVESGHYPSPHRIVPCKQINWHPSPI